MTSVEGTVLKDDEVFIRSELAAAAKQNPDSVLAGVLKAELIENLSARHAAAAVLHEGRDGFQASLVHPDNVTDARIAVAYLSAMVEVGDTAQALKYLPSLTSRRLPSVLSAMAWQATGEAYASRGQSTEAIRAFQQAIELYGKTEAGETYVPPVIAREIGASMPTDLPDAFRSLLLLMEISARDRRAVFNPDSKEDVGRRTRRWLTVEPAVFRALREFSFLNFDKDNDFAEGGYFCGPRIVRYTIKPFRGVGASLFGRDLVDYNVVLGMNAIHHRNYDVADNCFRWALAAPADTPYARTLQVAPLLGLWMVTIQTQKGLGQQLRAMALLQLAYSRWDPRTPWAPEITWLMDFDRNMRLDRRTMPVPMTPI